MTARRKIARSLDDDGTMRRRGIAEVLATMRPSVALDVGCGCGEFTRFVSGSCGRMVAVDRVPSLASRWNVADSDSEVEFCCMDGRSLGFPNDTFPVVFERSSLHHIGEWRDALSEMFRVSNGHILLEEEVDDPRTAAKRNSIAAQQLYLELQQEVGYSHYAHLEADCLLTAVREMGTVVTAEFLRREDPVDFAECFRDFPRFARESEREEYWQARLEAFRRELAGEGLCEDDTLVILAKK